MKRYFEIVDQKQVLELDIENGSPASKAAANEIGKAFKMDLKELTLNEYRTLKALYAK